MKKKGSRSDFNAQRDAELRQAFFNQGVYSTNDRVIKRTVKTPTSRFWVDPDRARDIMSRIEKDPSSIKRMNPERQRMYLSLYEKYQKLRRKCPSYSKIEAVTIAIYSGAPEFFLAPSTARSIIYNNAYPTY
ncbi:MAG: hypothetical protein K2I08_10825 [Muribaculaceae bacterium]|nr:hypothetical protein [Muribaculaceae bacterium]